MPATSPNGSRPGPDTAGVIPSGQAPARHDQRERILDSMARNCATKGYGATSVADIVEAAGVSRATFYELFKDKEDCLYAAMERAVGDAMSTVTEQYSSDKPWVQRVQDATAALLDKMASNPAATRMALIEAPASGGRAAQLYTSSKQVLVALLDKGREDPIEEEAAPSSSGRAALAAAESLIVGHILAGRTDRLLDLLPDVVYITVVPYLGQAEALQQTREAEKKLSEA